MGTYSVPLYAMHYTLIYISLYTYVYNDSTRILCLDWLVHYEGDNVAKRILAKSPRIEVYTDPARRLLEFKTPRCTPILILMNSGSSKT